MVWILLGIFSSISNANHQIIGSVAQPNTQVVLECSELPTAMDDVALEKELPNLKVVFFEMGYRKGWFAQYGKQKPSDLDEFRLFAFEMDPIPDFWTAWAHYTEPNHRSGFLQLVSSVKSIEKNGRKKQVLDIHLYDGKHNGARIMRMYCNSLQTWI